MNALDMALSKLHAPEVIEKLRALNELGDFEQQGYEAAKYIIQVTDMTPEELLAAVAEAGEPSGEPDNIKRTIGVIRWCLDQRGRG